MGEHLVKIRCIKCEVDNWVDDNDPIECPTCNTKNTLPAGMATKEYPVEPRMNLSDRPGKLYDEGHPNQNQWDQPNDSELLFRINEDDGYHD